MCPSLSPAEGLLIPQRIIRTSAVAPIRNHGRFLKVSHPNLMHDVAVNVSIYPSGYHGLAASHRGAMLCRLGGQDVDDAQREPRRRTKIVALERREQ